jgi:predicted TIM-barrel fold metal-dependent hydrolase
VRIVDAQVHLWGADTPERPWPPGRAAEAQKPYPRGEDREWVMGRGVCEWLGWPLPRT